MKHYLLVILSGLLFLSSCKSSKITTDASGIAVLPTKKVISNHYNNAFDKKTVSAKINAKYNDSKTTVSVVIKFRLEKDKTIWLSATKLGIPLAKALITPYRVSYYEKLDRTYFDGDFSLLSKWLGTELDFEKVQNLLLGQAVTNLKKGNYQVSIQDKTYQLMETSNTDLVGFLFFINPEIFKVNRQEIKNETKQQLLSISYPTYSKIEGEFFPENIHIRAIDGLHFTNIEMEYKSVEFNEDLSFPFEIPNGYKEIVLK